ncbi:MAG: PLP-dependent lyase/thiolase [Patescibacteria group bacterium]
MKTPQESYKKLNDFLKIDIYLKREDLHHYGSHKGRSIPLMIKKYFKEEKIKKFIISSSGNAALAAIFAVQNHNSNNEEKIQLSIFVGKNINTEKLKRLNVLIENDKNIILKQVNNPKQEAFKTEKQNFQNEKTKFLRQSTDENALIGYQELAEELINIPNLKAIFIPTSSGTTAEALGNSFEEMKKHEKIKEIPEIHIVQTTSCFPIAQEIFKQKITKEKSLADAIVDKIAHRKNKVLEKIKNSQGSAWIINNEEIKKAQELIAENCDLAISNNSALSFAGLLKALENNWKFNSKDAVVCLITGL